MIKKLSLIILSTFILFSNVSAQELEKGRIFTLDDFSGGLATKPNNYSLKKNQADIIENIRLDSESKSISKRDKTVVYGTASATSPILGMHRLYLNTGTKVLLTNYSNKVAKGDDTTGLFTDILTTSNADRRWQWLTWHNIAIGTDGYNQPVKYDGTSTSATYLGSALATDAGSGAGPDGTYNYKVVCYTTSYSLSLGATSNSVVVTDNDINLTMIPICPDTYLGEDITGRKIYRSDNTGSGTYKLLSNGTIADNTSVTLTDSDADGALGADLSVTSTATPPKGRLSIIHKNRLWIANDPSYPSRIYYSDDSSHDYFPAINYMDIRANDGDEVTFIKNLLGKLTVGKNNTIQKIYTDGDTPADDWEISDPFSHIGSHAIYSAANTPLGIIYLSNNGIYTFNGQNSELISDIITPEIKDINPSNFAYVWGEYYKNAYYITYTSEKTGASTNDKILILDLITGAFSTDILGINIFYVLRSGTDIEALYSGSSSVGKIFAHVDTIKELVHKTHSDFTGTFDDMRYIPVEVGGDSTSPVLELSWDVTIDSVTSPTMDAVVGRINRPAIGGSYTSQVLNLNASSFDKLYWNETIPASGGDITFKLRTATSDTAVTSASWSSTVSNPTGSDISNISANSYVQYYISMDTTDIAYTPTIYKSNNYNVKLTYNTTGTSNETTIPLHYRSGWLDLEIPGYKKTLRKIYVYYESDSTGTLSIKVEDIDGEEDTFDIDLATYPSNYTEYFTNGALTGELFRLDIQENSLNKIKIKKILIMYDIEPLT